MRAAAAAAMAPWPAPPGPWPRARVVASARRVRRLLPPLLLLLVLGWIVARTLARPEREAAQARIQGWWEQADLESRDKVVELAKAYAAEFDTDADRRFAAHAFLRARRADQAILARWPTLDQPLPAAEVQAFAQEALRALGWDDEACTRPALQNLQCMLALLEGGHEPTRRWVEGLIAREPKETMFRMMRRSIHMRVPSAKAVLAAACRRRAAAEGQQVRATEGADPVWSIAAAQLQLGPQPYPERNDDIELLVSVLEGPFRTQYPPRWTLSARVLGASEDPQALDALRRMAARLEASGTDRDDVTVLKVATVASGDWTHEELLRSLFGPVRTVSPQARAVGPEVLLDRMARRDPRAAPLLAQLWEGEGMLTPQVRELLARALLLGPEPPGPEVPVERLLADLEAPQGPAYLQVLAGAWRVRAGEPGAREALLRWLARSPSGGMGDDEDVERASAPLVTALRALYLYR